MTAHPAIAATALIGSAILLASCASDASPGDAPAAEETGTVIQHALGETEIPANIERVATVGWGNQDVALALGIAPVGVDDQTWSWDSSDGLGIYDWTIDAYAELGAEEPVVFDTTDGPDFEAIADVQPDVILAAYSGIDADQYATLSDIAPTVAYPEVPWFTPWRETIRLDSAALNMADEGEALVEELDDQIADAVADAPNIEGKTAAFFYISAADVSGISAYGVDDSRTAFLGDLGFEFPEVAITASEDGAFYADISSENADQLADVDVIVSYGDGEVLAALQADPLWSTLPAVQNGAVVEVGNGDAFSGAVTPTALSIPWMLDDYVGMLDDAAAASAE